MTTLPATRPGVAGSTLGTWAAAAIGAATFAAAMTAGELFALNSDAADAPAVGVGDVALHAVVVLAGVALAARLGTRALSRGPQSVERTALGLALGAAATTVLFWTGWPLALGAVATYLAVEHRRRVGSLSGIASAAAVVATLAFATTALFCVIG